MKKLFIAALLVISSISAWASSLSLSGVWVDADNNRTTIIQNSDKIILTRESVKMNGNVKEKTVSIVINNNNLTGTLSDDNLVITWSKGSQWYREISGSWKNKKNSKETFRKW